MTTLDLDQPSDDPDGKHLMASLRARLRRESPKLQQAPDEQYRPALAAVQALLQKRQALQASESELIRLRYVADTLQSLASVGK